MFTINRYGSIMENTYRLSQTNLITNGNFESGSLTGYATTTNWTLTSAPTSTPNGVGQYCVVATENATSTLETNKVTVTASGSYLLEFVYGADGTPVVSLWPNNLTTYIRFFDSSNVFVSQIQINNNRIHGSNTNLHNVSKRFTVPFGATKLSVKFVNRHGGVGVLPGATVLDSIRVYQTSTTSQLPFLETHRPVGENVSGGFSDLRYTHSYRSGYKEAYFSIEGKSSYLWSLLRTALGQHIEVYYESQCVFEGIIWQMDGDIAGYGYNVSYDQLFNYIVVGYGDKGKKYTLRDTESISRYGMKTLMDDTVVDNLSAAKARAKSLMALHSSPLPRIDSSIESETQDKINITCMGYLATLDWTYVPPRYLGAERDIAEAVATLSPSEGLSVINAVSYRTPNDFISNDYGLVESVGTYAPVPDRTAQKTSLNFMNDYMDLGDSDGKVIVSGVTKGRKLYMRSRPSDVGMYAIPSLDGKMDFFDSAGQEIPRPLVQSGIFVMYGMPIPTLKSYSDIILNPSAVFIKEIEYNVGENNVRITTPNSDPLDVSLARLFRRRR